MAFGLLDDDLHDSRKVRSFTDAEVRLWVMSISYSRKHRTRGYLTAEDVEEVGHRQKIVGRRLKMVVDGLVKKRGYDVVSGGFRVHGWDKMPYDRLTERGQKAASSRWKNVDSAAVQKQAQPISEYGADAQASDLHPTGIYMDDARARTPSPAPSLTPRRELRTSRPTDFEVAAAPLENEDPPVSRDQLLMLWATHHGWPAGEWPQDHHDDRVLLSAWWGRGWSLRFWRAVIDDTPVGARMRYLTTPPEDGKICRLEERHIDWIRSREKRVPEPDSPRTVGQVLRQAMEVSA